MDTTAAHILIVDDEPSLLKLLSVYLHRMGFTVTTAQSTEQAWACVEENPAAFAVAVVDATMPGLRAEDLALRMLHSNPTLCVLVASGYPVDISAVERAAPGRASFLHKPFTPEMLAAAVRRMLARKEKNI